MSHPSDSEGEVPGQRVRRLGPDRVSHEGDYVLYWMTASRRANWNFALDRALEWSAELHKPIVVLEPLRCDYQWASDRLHHFILDGMADNARQFENSGIFYYPYVEHTLGAGRGLLRAIAANACIIVADDFPCFFLPRMLEAAAQKVPVAIEAVDSNGILPIRSAGSAFPTAYAFRRFLQKNLSPHLLEFPSADPVERVLHRYSGGIPSEVTERWPPVSLNQLTGDRSFVASLPIDHNVQRAPLRGGTTSAESALREFLSVRLSVYSEDRNAPSEPATSGLSPYLHFGHISAHEIFSAIADKENWSIQKTALRANGSRTGWWGTSPSAEAFLDQLVTWRELGLNACVYGPEYDQYNFLPAWAKKTLASHASDEREYIYSLDEFERGATHDPIWNAAQKQLISEGQMHNYLRMLWGKKILEWTESPESALKIMIELNNKFALDGRDPNSYSGIFWCLGRYDRPWGPERPIFGTVRYMSSANTARKLDLREYLRRYVPEQAAQLTKQRGAARKAR